MLSPWILATIVLVQGIMFYNQHSYTYHVDRAKGSLSSLQASILSTDSSENELEEGQVGELVEKMVNSTEDAIEIADDVRRVTKLKKVIDEITKLQNEEIEVISNAIETIKDESINQQIALSMDKTIDLQEKVGQANIEIQAAIDNNQDTIEIDIVTDKDGETHDSEDHEEDEAKHSALAPKRNANLERIERQKLEDAAQREANRKRIKLIEKGNEAKKAQKMKNKLSKAKNQQASSQS